MRWDGSGTENVVSVAQENHITKGLLKQRKYPALTAPREGQEGTTWKRRILPNIDLRHPLRSFRKKAASVNLSEKKKNRGREKGGGKNGSLL